MSKPVPEQQLKTLEEELGCLSIKDSHVQYL
jgi:hypothetical protein